MASPTYEALFDAWTARSRRSTTDNRLHAAALDLLADGAPVAADALAQATGQPIEAIHAWLERLANAGYELDAAGRLVGAALTLRPTPYRFRVRSNDLYAWCGFDTLFLPRLLAEPAQVDTRCPVTGEQIRLSLESDGRITTASPDTTVVAIAGPTVTANCSTTGPASPVCSQMPLFNDAVAGEQWAEHHPGVAIVDLNEAVQLARGYADQHGRC
jgi:alkylmercury lyase